MNEEKEVQTTEDIPEIPEGIEIPNSSGSLIPDEGEPEEVSYDDVDLEEPTDEEEDDGEATE